MGTAVALRSTASMSSLAVALVLAAYYVGLAMGPLTIGNLIARIGHIRIFTSAAAASSASFLILPLWVHPVPWILLRTIAGYTMATMFVVLESWLHSKATRTSRGALLAVYIITSQLALACGQLLLFIYPPSDDRVFILAGLLHALALVPIALTFIEQPPPHCTERYGLRALWTVAPLGIVGCFASGIIVGTVLTLGPICIRSLGYSAERAAVFVLVVATGGLTLQWNVGKLSDRIGRRPVMISVGLALGLVASLLAIQTEYGQLLILAGPLGALAFLIYPLATAYANDLVEHDKMVAVSGTLIVTFGTGALSGPILGTVATRVISAGGPFWMIAATGIIIASSSAFRLIVRPAIPREGWTDYAPLTLPQATPAGTLQPDVPIEADVNDSDFRSLSANSQK